MKKYAIIFISLFVQIIVFGQKTVTITNEYGVENPELLELLAFQKIAVEKFNFESPEIKGKYYQIFVREFKNGQLIDTKVLFNETGVDQFKITLPIFDFKIFTQISENNLRIQLRTQRYASAYKDFVLMENSNDYVMKDFFGAKSTIQNPLNEEFPLLAIITPTKHSDGSGSYCEVVQSNIKPENLGEHFKIPHYFLISMKFE